MLIWIPLSWKVIVPHILIKDYDSRPTGSTYRGLMGDLQDPKMGWYGILYHFGGHISGDIPENIGLKNRPSLW